MAINWLAVFVSALVPLLLGYVWYHPKVFGNAWMKEAGMTDEKKKSGNMAVIFGVSLLLSLMLAFVMTIISYHQTFVANSLMNQPGFGDPNSDVGKYLADYMAKYGTNFRTYGHGFAHGVLISGIFIALPVIGVNALFERKSFKYVAINAGFWILCMGIMGAIVCGWM